MAISITATTSGGTTVVTSSSIAFAGVSSTGVAFTPFGNITAVNVQTALQQVDTRIGNISAGGGTGTATAFTPYGTITATNVQQALEQLADQNFRTASTPTGSNVNEGDTWYDTSTEQFKVYRETSVGVFQWVPIMLGTAGQDSDTQDAGTF